MFELELNYKYLFYVSPRNFQSFRNLQTELNSLVPPTLSIANNAKSENIKSKEKLTISINFSTNNLNKAIILTNYNT